MERVRQNPMIPNTRDRLGPASVGPHESRALGSLARRIGPAQHRFFLHLQRNAIGSEKQLVLIGGAVDRLARIRAGLRRWLIGDCGLRRVSPIGNIATIAKANENVFRAAGRNMAPAPVTRLSKGRCYNNDKMS